MQCCYNRQGGVEIWAPLLFERQRARAHGLRVKEPKAGVPEVPDSQIDDLLL